MKRTLIIALMAAFLMATGFSTGAFAQGMGHMGMGMGNAQLSVEQQAVLQKIYQEQGQAISNLSQQLMDKQYELNTQLASPNADEKRTQVLAKEITELNGKILEARISLQKQLAKEGLPVSAGFVCPMMGGTTGHGGGTGMPMSCPMMHGGMGMMGGGMQHGGMQHGGMMNGGMGMMGNGMQPGNGTINHSPTGHGGNAPVNQ
jgi:zinc resistance-associated protein